ncbi:MAG TPA: hypothetical protein VF118_07600 [Gemmatimonadaceae bacterium]
MQHRKRKIQTKQSGGVAGGGTDSRFARLCDALAADPRYRKPVVDFKASAASGLPRRFGSNGLRVDEKIFAMLAQGTLVVKLPRARVDELVAAGHGERFDPGHGRIMKEWFVATGSTLVWADLAREAHDFVTHAGNRVRERGNANER